MSFVKNLWRRGCVGKVLVVLLVMMLCSVGTVLLAGIMPGPDDGVTVPAAPPPTSMPRPTDTPDHGSDGAAMLMCEKFVLDKLKAPSTADFGRLGGDGEEAVFLERSALDNLGVDTSILVGPGAWVVIGVVDAENSFGAMLRSTYSCTLFQMPDGETWRLLDIAID